MKTINHSITIYASKEATWDLLFNRFGDVNLFNPLIKGSQHTAGSKGEVGCERSCKLNDDTVVTEKITKASGNDSFTVSVIDGGMAMMGEMNADFELTIIDDNITQVDTHMHYSTKPGFLALFVKPMMKKMFFKVLIGLKYYLETDDDVTKENTKSIIHQFNDFDQSGKFAHAA